MLRVDTRIARVGKPEVVVAVEAQAIDVRTMGEALPAFIAGAVVYRLEFASWRDLVDAVRAVAPAVTEEQLRAMLRAKGAALIDQVLHG